MSYMLGWQRVHTPSKSEPQYFAVQVLAVETEKADIKIHNHRLKVNKDQIYPRDQSIPNDLLSMKYVNEAEVQRCTKGKVVRLGNHCLLNTKNHYEDQCKQSERFYDLLLSRVSISHKPEIIIADTSINHIQAQYFFKSLQHNKAIWPYKINPTNIYNILQILYTNTTVKINLNFCKRQIDQISIRPLNLRHKYNPLILSKFISKDNIADYPTTQLGKRLSDSLLSLNLSIEIVRKIFRLCSAIHLFSMLKIQEFTVSNYYTALRICPQHLSKISILLNLKDQSLENLILNNYHPDKKKSVEKRVTVLNAILFEQLMLKICDWINEKLKTKANFYEKPNQNQLTFLSVAQCLRDRDISCLQMDWIHKRVIKSFQAGAPNDSDLFPTQKYLLDKLKRQQSLINQHLIDDDLSYYLQYKAIRNSKQMIDMLEICFGRISQLENNSIIKLLNVNESKQLKYSYVLSYTEEWKSAIKNQHQFLEIIKGKIMKQKQKQVEHVHINVRQFANIYKYASAVKKVHRQTMQQASQMNLQDRICSTVDQKQFKILQKNTVQLSIAAFETLQKQLKEQRFKIAKIINQYRVYTFRKNMRLYQHKAVSRIKSNNKLLQFILNIKRFYYRKIKLWAGIKTLENCYKTIKLRIYRQFFSHFRKYTAIRLMSESIRSKMRKNKIIALKSIKKYAGITKLSLALKNIQKTKKRSFMIEMKKIRAIYNIQELFHNHINRQPFSSIYKISKQRKNIKKEQFIINQNDKKIISSQNNNQKTTIKKKEPINKQNDNKEISQQSQIQIKITNPPYKRPLIIETSEPSNPPSVLNTPNDPPESTFILKPGNPQKQLNIKIIESQIKEEKSIDQKSELDKKSKKSKQRLSERSQNLHEISRDQLENINDNPKFSLDIWMKKVGSPTTKNKEPPKVNHRIFSKYQSNKFPEKQQQEFQLDLPKIDEGFKARISVHPFFAFIRKNVREGGDQVIKESMCHQSHQLLKPLLNFFPQNLYPNAYKQCFNCILKIGGDKNSSKKLWQLLNIIVKPIHQSYDKQYASVQNIFEDEPTLYPDYSSPHNIIKDQIFLYFLKQLLANQNQHSMQCLVEALTVLTRYYYPSPMFIYEFINCMQNIYQNTNFQQIQLALENTLLMAQAMEGNKGTCLRVYDKEEKQKDTQSTDILYLRKSPFNQKDMKKPKIKICLLNNQVFVYFIRNESIRTIKRKILAEIGLSRCFNDFGIYHQEGSTKSKTIIQSLIPDNTKAIDLAHSLTEYSILYLKIKHYFPFNVKDFYISRIVYLNMIHDEHNLPWNQKDYEMLVGFSMHYDEFDEIRIANYLKISKQSQSKQPNMKGINEALAKLSNSRSQQICEFQYFKYMKQMRFFLAKAYPCNNNMVVVIKPLQITIYQNNKLISSIELSRVTSVYIQKKSVICEIVNIVKDQRHLRQFTIFPLRNHEQLYQILLHYIQAIQ